MNVSRCPTEQLSPGDGSRLAEASLFLSPEFASTWQTQGGTPVTWVVEDGGKATSLLPGVEFGRRPMLRFLSMPNGCYGGMVAPSKHKKESGRILLTAIANYHYATTHIYDLRSTLHPDDRFEEVWCQTSLVDISDPDWFPPDKKLRQQIRKAEKEGIEIVAFNDEKHMDGFLRLVRTFERRTGQKCKYSLEYFSSLASLAAKDKRLRWFWCEFEGVPVSSNIFVIDGDQLLHWQAYFDEAYSFLQPEKYIPFYATRNLVQHDLKYLNLGASPEGVDGVEFYKSKWGGDIFRYKCLVRRKGLGRFR